MYANPERSQTPFVVVDWGSSRLRLYLVDGGSGDGAGSTTAEFASDQGIATLREGDHERVFLQALDSLLERAPGVAATRVAPARIPGERPAIDVYLLGMVTSDLGWRPTPYVGVPAGPEELLAGARIECLEARPAGLGGPVVLRLHFFPGVRTVDDIIRGEEIEVLGILRVVGAEAYDRESKAAGAAGPSRAVADGVVLLPGTHSKWIRCRSGAITEFVTVPTGDLHAALHRDTMLARTLPDCPVRVEGELLLRAFDDGAREASRRGALSTLFQVRSRAILGSPGGVPERASAFLSGVLIGAEVQERTSRLPAGDAVILGGSAYLQGLYGRVLSSLTDRRVRIMANEMTGSASVHGILELRSP